MSTTFARPILGFHLALSPEALAQATVSPSFTIKQGGVAIPEVNGQYKLAVTSDNRLVFDIEATDYFADANPVPAWVPSSWNLPGTGNYVLLGKRNTDQSVSTAQTFWAHGGNQGVSNVPQFEVPINGNGEFTIPRTTPSPLLSFDVQIHTDEDDNLFLQGVDSNNQPVESDKIYRIDENDPGLKPYWQVFTTAAFGQSNPVQEIFKQIII